MNHPKFIGDLMIHFLICLSYLTANSLHSPELLNEFTGYIKPLSIDKRVIRVKNEINGLY
jgi:hypothetical protein